MLRNPLNTFRVSLGFVRDNLVNDLRKHKRTKKEIKQKQKIIMHLSDEEREKGKNFIAKNESECSSAYIYVYIDIYV